MSRIGKRALTVVLALVVTLTAGAVDPVTAAGSDDTSGVDTSDVFGEPLESFLQHYPNARRAADGSYDLEPGVRLVPPRSTSDIGIMEAPSGCPGQRFCVYQDREFGEWSIEYSSCLWRTLAPEHRNQISSMHNTQNSHTAYFADTGPNPDVRGALGPNRYLRDLSKDTAPDGRSWNDRIDALDPTNRC